MSLIERAAARALEDRQSAIDDDRATVAELDTSLNMTSGLPSNTEPVSLSEKHLQKQGCLTRGDNVSPLAQEYRRIKRPLLFNLRSKIQEQGHPSGANLIMITSAMPGEGKSFVSVNLALSIAAEIDQTVLLIDTDVTKRGAAAILGIDRLPGLLDVVVGEQSVEDVLVKTDISTQPLFENGKFNESLSEIKNLPKNVVVASLANSLENESVKQHLGKYASIKTESFIALNSAFIYDGAFIHIPANE